jgi:hypothetical protein
VLSANKQMSCWSAKKVAERVWLQGGRDGALGQLWMGRGIRVDNHGPYLGDGIF